MASSDNTDAVVTPLSLADLPEALALSASAHWNQNTSDWRTMLELGTGFGIRATDEQGQQRLAASTIVLPYGSEFAWVSMVLVLPAFQRRGFASQLLRHALADLSARGMAGVLDATPAGHAVYLQEGFRDTWGFARYRRERAAAMPDRPAGPPTRALRDTDWPAVEAIDTPSFGASRLPLLRSLATRWPQAARVVEQGGRIRGFMFGRDGREAHQLGPLLAESTEVAQSLIADGMREAPGPVYLDLLDDRKPELLPWLQQQGFAFQRPFTRMVVGASRAPGDKRHIVLVAGPELG